MELPIKSGIFESPCPGQANGLSSYYFSQVVQMLLATHCLLGNPDDYPRDFANDLKNNDDFDFVVVGGGSAGSVIANRLTEISKWKILLIEAGDNPTFESDIPAFSLSLPGRELDWKFEVNSSLNSCLGMENNSCPLFQGKVLGGTSTINNMHYVRGNRFDYDEWKKLGNVGWGFDDILEYFKKSEKIDDEFVIVKNNSFEAIFREYKNLYKNNEPKLHAASKMVADTYHSNNGTMSINHFAYDYSLSRLKKIICDGAEELDIPFVPDINWASQIGCSQTLATIHEGNRGNAAKSFLTRIKSRKNLFVAKNAMVEKLITEGKTVKGVELLVKDKKLNISAKKEVILAAGAINSPRLLLLSGIGPLQKLEALGIKVVHDLPGVGENLRMPISFFGFPVVIDNKVVKHLSHLQKLDAMYEFISRGVGFFGNIGINDVVTFFNVGKNGSVPDIEFIYYINRVKDYLTFNELLMSLKIKNEIRDQYAKVYSKDSLLLVCPTLLRPKSKGRLELKTSDFETPPKITANFFEDKDDVNVLIQGIRRARDLINTTAFQELSPRLLRIDIAGCKNLKFDSDEYWECMIRHLSSSMHDASGTCKMGTEEDEMTVVNSDLKVRGIKNLRIADSSIIPVVVRGSTSIASVMIGERVSDLIKNDWKESKHEEL